MSILKPQPTRSIKDDPRRRDVMFFRNRLGLKICVYNFPPDPCVERKGVIILCHGLDTFAEAEYVVRPGFQFEGSFLEALCKSGWDVWSLDNQGMGRSESVIAGFRGMIFDYDDYVQDVIQLRRILGDKFPSCKRFMLVGNSMGGCIVIRSAQREPRLFQGVAALSGAIGSFEKVKARPENKVILPLLSVLSKVAPWLKVGSKSPMKNQAILAEALQVGAPLMRPTSKMRARYCTEGIRAGEACIQDALRLNDTPVLLIHNPLDQFCDFKGSWDLFTKLKKSHCKLVSTFSENVGEEHDLIQTAAVHEIANAVTDFLSSL